ncbi:MAG: glycosyl hydrolase 108 family protein [Bacillota bacterium]|nr:glycosyl hydrolase 108 family protein [Bacillota bacterium]
MASFDIAVEFVLLNEKGVEINEADPGGITNRGISLRFLKAIDSDKLKLFGIFDKPNDETIKTLDIIQTKNIYYDQFWVHAPFEKLHSQELCNYLFDSAVNMGIAPAVKALQRACWSVFGCRSNHADDGILGENTLYLVNSIRDMPALLCALRSERAGDYRLIAALNPTEKQFLNGWLNRAYD